MISSPSPFLIFVFQLPSHHTDNNHKAGGASPSRKNLGPISKEAHRPAILPFFSSCLHRNRNDASKALVSALSLPGPSGTLCALIGIRRYIDCQMAIYLLPPFSVGRT